MQNKQMKQMMNGAVVLSAAAFVSKFLSALYKVPFQNLTGNEGFYVYQQVYPFYGLALALSLNGLPVFLSKLTAEEKSPIAQWQLLKRASVIVSLISLLFFLLTQFGAGHLAGWMGDRQLKPMIQAVSWMYLFVPILSVYRGFFQGNLQMMPTAISQVAEQLVRVAVILATAFLFYKNGGSVYEMGTQALHSSWLSAITASVVLFLFYLKNRPKEFAAVMIMEETIPTYRLVAKRILTEGLTISLIGSLMILLQLVDSFTVYKGLLQTGVPKEAAIELKGIFDRGQPLVQLGMVAGVGLASGLLPLLRMQQAGGREKAFLSTSRSVLRITAVFAGAAAFGLAAVMPYLNKTLFDDRAGTAVLQVMVVSVLLISLISAYNAILQSLDKHRLIFRGVLLAVVIKAIGNWLLVSYLGTIGASLATVLALSMLYLTLRLLSPDQLKDVGVGKRFLKKLSLSLTGMVLAVWSSLTVLERIFLIKGRTAALFLTLVGVAVGAGVFGYLIIHLNVLTIREWLSIPFGKRLLRGREK